LIRTRLAVILHWLRLSWLIRALRIRLCHLTWFRLLTG
jgi:hypothetical protein